MMKLLPEQMPEVWGGLECTINRVGDRYFDQLEDSGHRNRQGDMEMFASLGIKKMRYPVLWEEHQQSLSDPINWTDTADKLNALRKNEIDVIAGLVHHGSGPSFVHIMDDSFAAGLATYAAQVAGRFPWIEYYTPVNEPLTTARFCGLYGIWFPHESNDQSFCRMVVNECKATVLAMQAIRKVNPDAKLVQTDDLGKVHSTPKLKYQAAFENERRWLAFDLTSGRVDAKHKLYDYLTSNGITAAELSFFVLNPCQPNILGVNYYITSERYLDENRALYPKHSYGSNNIHTYADVEAVRVGHVSPDGAVVLIKEAWERYEIPIAVTEVHLHCTREEQMRWLHYLWTAAIELQEEGVSILAITAWALLGSFGWDKLLTQPHGTYEPGIFDLTGNLPRPTILASMLRAYSQNKAFVHPVLASPGWWQRSARVAYGTENVFENSAAHLFNKPIFISGIHANLLGEICESRCLNFQMCNNAACDTSKIAMLAIANQTMTIQVPGKQALNIRMQEGGSLWIMLNKGLDLYLDEEEGAWELDNKNRLVKITEELTPALHHFAN